MSILAIKREVIEDTFSHWERLAADKSNNDHSTLGASQTGKRFADVKQLEELMSVDMKNRNILDVGAGYGRFTVSIAEKCCSVTAVEVCPSMINRLAANCNEHGVKNKINIIRADARYLPIQATSNFDGVFCYAVLYILPKKHWDPILKNCSNMLTNKGWMLLTLKHWRNAFRPRFAFGLLYVAAYAVLKIEQKFSKIAFLSKRYGLHGRTEYLISKKNAEKMLLRFFLDVKTRGSPYAVYICKNPRASNLDLRAE
ncbi:MAG: class I SAM-dependent methyltransferase [Candidatus Bathyarchaeota archaeon]|nr:class I SAM-dependent methyltransferase [Candidatus Bathyarchaeota archaeon]